MKEAEVQKLIKEALGQNKTAKTLDLSNKHIDDEGAIVLAKILAKNKTWRFVNLRGNHITAKGMKALSDALDQNTTLHFLDRNDQGPDPKALEESEKLAALLSRNPNTKIQTLDFSHNEIGPEGARALAAHLSQNTTLQTLDLSPNPNQIIEERLLRNRLFQGLNELYVGVTAVLAASERIYPNKNAMLDAIPKIMEFLDIPNKVKKTIMNRDLMLKLMEMDFDRDYMLAFATHIAKEQVQVGTTAVKINEDALYELLIEYMKTESFQRKVTKKSPTSAAAFTPASDADKKHKKEEDDSQPDLKPRKGPSHNK